MSDCPPPPAAPWRVYPFTLVPGDSEMVFPTAEAHQDVATDTYYASGFLRGEASGRRYAFMTIFAKNERIFSVLNADFYVFALTSMAAATTPHPRSICRPVMRSTLATSTSRAAGSI